MRIVSAFFISILAAVSGSAEGADHCLYAGESYSEGAVRQGQTCEDGIWTVPPVASSISLFKAPPGASQDETPEERARREYKRRKEALDEWNSYQGELGRLMKKETGRDPVLNLPGYATK